MNNSIKPIVSLLAALVLSSCFQHETTIHLQKDGTGTLVEETRLSGQMLGMLSLQQAPPGDDATHTDPLSDMLSEDKANARGAKLGEGVSFVKAEPVEVGTSKGARITYRFTDINKLRINMDDAMKHGGPLEDARNADNAAANDSKPIVFEYKDGLLTIRPAVEKNGDNPDDDKINGADTEFNDEQGLAIMKPMLAGLKLSIKIIVDSGIAESNAAHREADTITLLELDMDKLMKNPENLDKLAAIDPGNPAAAMEAMQGIDGIKTELQPEVTVRLK